MDKTLEKRIFDLDQAIKDIATINSIVKEQETMSNANAYMSLAVYRNLCKIQGYFEITDSDSCGNITKERVDEVIKKYEAKFASLIKQALNNPILETG